MQFTRDQLHSWVEGLQLAVGRYGISFVQMLRFAAANFSITLSKYMYIVFYQLLVDLGSYELLLHVTFSLFKPKHFLDVCKVFIYEDEEEDNCFMFSCHHGVLFCF